MSKCEQIQTLLHGYLDQQLTQQQAQQVQLHINGCAKCRAELARMMTLKGQVQKAYQNSTKETTTTTQWLGWLLFLGGILPLIGFAIWQFVSDNSLPLWVRLALGAVSLGSVLLFVSVLRQRRQAAKTDRYKDVQF